MSTRKYRDEAHELKELRKDARKHRHVIGLLENKILRMRARLRQYQGLTK